MDPARNRVKNQNGPPGQRQRPRQTRLLLPPFMPGIVLHVGQPRLTGGQL